MAPAALKLPGRLFRTRRRSSITLSAVVIAVLLLILTWELECSKKDAPPEFRVTRVIDGDTIVLSNGERVRYIGVDTPERDEPFYLIARKFNRDLVEGRQIRIELDIQERDRYGRLLGYVYVDTLFVNATLVRDGMAVVATYPPNVKYVSLFTSLQKQARSNGLGLWSKE